MVDLIVIATRTGRHVADFVAYGQFGRRVLIEKPIAPCYSLGQAVQSSAIAESTAVSAPLRFMDGYAAVSGLLPRVGRILNVDVVCQSWLPNWRPGADYRTSYSADPDEGGVLRDLVHEIDYALDLFGVPESVSAYLGHSEELGIQAESSATLRWDYSDFALSMNLDFASRESRRYLAVHGESATITWNVLEATVHVEGIGHAEVHVKHFPGDLSRDGVLMRQVNAMASPKWDRRLCRVPEALRAIALCDAARASDLASTPTTLIGPTWELE